MNEMSVSPTNPAFQAMLSKLNSDMRFVGIITIIGGAISCLGIITAIVGVPLIISGMRLREAADSFTTYLASNDLAVLQQGLERQSRYFFIQKVFIIIGLVLTGLYLIFFLAFFGTIMRSYQGY
ncbi:DUF5362 domain-containing protein [candidate division KSB1 bacterium]|nr:DUF5362 domain-containing protein [candidate division KSB1 bacterium]